MRFVYLVLSLVLAACSAAQADTQLKREKMDVTRLPCNQRFVTFTCSGSNGYVSCYPVTTNMEPEHKPRDYISWSSGLFTSNRIYREQRCRTE